MPAVARNLLERRFDGPPAAGTRIALIRHGESVVNVDELIGGPRGCRGLTERGVAQCEALAERLSRSGELAGAAALWTSVLPRAIESAAILAPVLGLGSAEESCSLCEQHPGEADGLSWAEYEVRYARRSLPGSDPELPISPGGENWFEFIRRAGDALSELGRRHPGELVVVVSHGGVIAASMVRFLGLANSGRGVQLHAENASITEWCYTGARWRLVRFNDIAHLAGADLAPTRPAWVDLEVPLSDLAQQV